MSLKLTVSSENKKRLNFIWIKQQPTLYSARKDRLFPDNICLMISVQWNLDITNLYITIKVLDITNDFPHPSNINYIKKNLDTVEPIDITKGQKTDKMYSLQSKVSLYRGSFSLTITGIRKTVRYTEDFSM